MSDTGTRILAIETATPVCSVAYSDRDGVIHEWRATGRGVHSEKLFLFLDELQQRFQTGVEELSEVLISGGPGSYTGLRIGASAVKGLLFQRETPLYRIGTLEAVGAGRIMENPELRRVHAVIDARRQHLYHQLLEVRTEHVEFGEVTVRPIAELEAGFRDGDVVAGTGIERLAWCSGEPDSGSARCFGPGHISAATLIRARNHPRFRERFLRSDPAGFSPRYLSMGQLDSPSG